MACKIRIKVKKKKYIRGDNTTMKYTSIIIPIVGGLGMFIYGMQIMAQGLENAAGNRMKSLLEALTKNKFFGVLLGAFITAVIQSSSATTVMVVGFVNAGIMNLQQAMGVIMGANIGTTATSWILSLSGLESDSLLVSLFKPTTFSPLLAFIGIVFLMFSKKEKKHNIGGLLIGFAILMTGMEGMSNAVSGLKDIPGFTDLFTMFSNPILGMISVSYTHLTLPTTSRV